MLGVQPVPRERLARRTLALRNFVFVVRKCQVDSAGVNIQCLAEIFHGHGGTLNVPAGSPRAERGLPEMLSGFRRFPQRKLPRTLLLDRKSTRLNSSHRCISYAVFCLKKKNTQYK